MITMVSLFKLQFDFYIKKKHHFFSTLSSNVTIWKKHLENNDYIKWTISKMKVLKLLITSKLFRKENYSQISSSGIFWANLAKLFLTKIQWKLSSSHSKYPVILCIVLPSFINVIYHKSAEDEEDEEGDKHVIYCPDVVHFKQLTVIVVQKNQIGNPYLNFKTLFRLFFRVI